ncbi:dynein light chain roadblock-type 2 protein [Chloropicon primus]|nr:dynein light chain roadblock-type 2 protein [Chloropicon primus]
MAQAATAAVEDTFKRINSHKGVEGIIVVSNDGIPIRTTLEPEITVQYAALVTRFTEKSKSVLTQVNGEDDLKFLRIRSKKHEIMIAPDKDYTLLVIQKPAVS